MQLLLKRFSGLFSAPQRVTALGAARDYEQVSQCGKPHIGPVDSPPPPPALPQPVFPQDSRPTSGKRQLESTKPESLPTKSCPAPSLTLSLPFPSPFPAPLPPSYKVTAEWKKANGLIKPGPRTNQVWASLYAEIEQVSGVSMRASVWCHAAALCGGCQSRNNRGTHT